MILNWKETSSYPFGGVDVSGREESWSKGFFLWRFQNPWMIFKVEHSCVLVREEGYWVYSRSDGRNHRRRKKVYTCYFAGRIGRGGVTFSATDSRASMTSLPIIAFPRLFNWWEIRGPAVFLGENKMVFSHEITHI